MIPGYRPEIDYTQGQPPPVRSQIPRVLVQTAPIVFQTPYQNKNFNLLPQFQSYAVSEQPYMISTQQHLFDGSLYGYYPLERKYG